MKQILFILIILFVSCQGNNQEALREEGRAKTRALISELKKIKTRDQLIELEGRIYHTMDGLKQLCDAADEYLKKHEDDSPLAFAPIDHELSDALRLELLRISRLDGGREILRHALTE